MQDALTWRFINHREDTVSLRVQARFTVNTAEGVLALVRAGAGIAVATDFSVTQDLQRGTLVRILEEWRLPRAGIHLPWPSMPQESPRLRALVDFPRDRLNHRFVIPDF